MPESTDSLSKRPRLASRDTGDTPRFVRRDLYLLVYIPAITLFAWLLPERWWWPFCRGLARLSLFVKRKATTYRSKLTELLGGRRLDVEVDEVARAYLANNHLRYLQGMRCYAPHGWRPHIRLVGREHIERALAAGKGAILWGAPMASRDLVAKMALHEAGFRVSHLSHYAHGFSWSLLGARMFNPIWTRVENRYLADRFVLSHAFYTSPIRMLVQRLRQNQVVSVTVADSGLRVETLPFLNGTIRLAEGAPALAVKTGAALLPLFVVQQADGSYVVNIDTPLQPVADRAEGDAIHALLMDMVQLLESYATRYPAQYHGWSFSGI